MHPGTEDSSRERLGWSSGGNREGRLLSVLHHLENNSTRLRMRGREARARGKEVLYWDYIHRRGRTIGSS